MSMRRLLSFWLCLLSLALAACGAAPTPTPSFGAPLSNRVPVHTDVPGEPETHVDPVQATEALQVTLVPSELVVGPNRFAVGLFDDQGKAIEDASVHFRYFDLTDKSAPRLESEADAERLTTADGRTSIFAQEREFNRAGAWGVEVQARLANGKSGSQRTAFTIVAQSPTLKPGQAVPALDTPTAASVENDYTKLTSSPTPNPEFYRLSLKQALTSGKATVLLFATPAFCQTRFCGPSYDMTSDLQKQYGGRANFIHVEVYSGLPNPAATNFQLAPGMRAFGLSTEPWLYIIGRDGKVAYRVEGLFTPAEIERHLKLVLGG